MWAKIAIFILNGAIWADMTNNALLMVLGTLALCVCVSGCTSSGTPFSDTPVSQYLPHPELHTNLVDQDSHWSLSKGVYYSVSYQVYNSGDGAAKNVYLNVQLVLDGSEIIDDSKQVYIGTLAPGASQTVSLDLDGDYDKSYRVRATATHD
jgi:hypothetical protein